MKSSIITKKYYKDGKLLTGFTLHHFCSIIVNMSINFKSTKKDKCKFRLSGENGEGFTIIELIISIFILSVAIIGIFSAFSIMSILTSNTVDQLTATYLAQEGLEVIINIRDSNWINMDSCPNPPCSGYTWVDGLHATDTDSICRTNGCEVDYTTHGTDSYPVKAYLGDYLNIDANGFYSYKTGTQSKFIRKIIIEPVLDVDGKSDHIIKVISQVYWDGKANILHRGYNAKNDGCTPYNCVTTEEMLYDWYNYVNQ